MNDTETIEHSHSHCAVHGDCGCDCLGHGHGGGFDQDQGEPFDATGTFGEGQGSQVNDYTALLSGSYWNYGEIGKSAVLTYSFGPGPEAHLTDFFNDAFVNSWRGLSETQKNDVRNAIAQLEQATGLTFYETAEGGDLTFQFNNFALQPGESGFAGFAYFPSSNKIGGDVFYDTQDYSPSSSILDISMHEIGHAVGLKHPFSGSPILSPELDNSANTIMSYTGPLQTTYGPLDIQALQHIYGDASNKGSHLSALSFDDVNDVVLQSGTGANDVIRGTSSKDRLLGNNGDDELYGSHGDDTINGGAGNDVIEGGTGRDLVFASDGNDVAYGGLGDDTLYMGNGDDMVVEYSNEASNDVIGGGGGQDTLDGGAGADTIFGGRSDATTASNDYINGGSGNDLIFGGRGNAAEERDTLFGGDGDDTFFSGVGTDYVGGGNGADLIFGGDGADRLLGEAGADVIWGGGGNDVMTGGAGADVFAFISGSGVDRITDFDVSADKIQLAGTARAFASFADVQAALTDTGAGAVLDLGGGASVTLSGVSSASLGAEDFLL